MSSDFGGRKSGRKIGWFKRERTFSRAKRAVGVDLCLDVRHGRQEERQRLAGTSRRDAEHVRARERGRPALALDARRLREVERGEELSERGRQVRIGGGGDRRRAVALDHDAEPFPYGLERGLALRAGDLLTPGGCRRREIVPEAPAKLQSVRRLVHKRVVLLALALRLVAALVQLLDSLPLIT